MRERERERERKGEREIDRERRRDVLIFIDKQRYDRHTRKHVEK